MFGLLFISIASFSTGKLEVKTVTLKKPEKCDKTASGSATVFCDVIARVEGQPLPIVNTTASGTLLKVKMDSQRVIPGFLKGINQQCIGEKRRLIIPANRAYGEEPYDGLFDPDSTWIVEVEVVDIETNVVRSNEEL